MAAFELSDNSADVGRSNRKFFDFSLMQGQLREVVQTKSQAIPVDDRKKDRKEEQSQSSAVDSVPPLDNVTTYELGGDDDDSSVSTVGSTTTPSARSLVFARYWTATGQVPSIGSSKRRSVSSDSCSPAAIQQPRRSIIFSATNRSFSSLPTPVAPKPMVMQRRSMSNGDINSSRLQNKAPLTSCLRRRPVYSGESIQRKPYNKDDDAGDDGTSTTSSVRFDLQATAIRHFQPPQEVHADDSWASYFQ